MKLSFAITVCNEELEVKRLINFLIKNKQPQDEICVLLDKPNSTHTLIDYLYWASSNDHIKLKEHYFNGHFGEWKTLLTQMCGGDYIINFDADEIPHLFLLENIHTIIETNPDIDLIWVPRINTLEADSKLDVVEYVKSQNWSINDKGWINWPNDYQGRIYKNSNQIYWIGKVHEKLTGYKAFSKLPALEEYSIYHPKTLDRQIKQNELYNKL